MTHGYAPTLSGGYSRKRGQLMQAIFSTVAAALAWLYNATPSTVVMVVSVLFVFGGMDQATGWLAAHAEARLSSEESRRKGAAKLGTYVVLVVGFWSIGMITGHWWLFAPVAAWVAGTEIMSLKENLNRMQAAGVALGPLGGINRALDALGRVITAAFPDSKEKGEGVTPLPDSSPGAGSTQD